MPEITFPAVADRMAEVLRVPAERLTPGTALADLAVDSLLMVEVVVDLQEEFESVIDQAGLHTVQTLGDLVEVLADGRIRA